MKTSDRPRVALSAALAFFVFFAAFPSGMLHALDIYAFSSGTASTESASPLYVDLRAGFEHVEGSFSLAAELILDSSGKFKAPYFGDYLGDFSIDIGKGSFSYSQGPFAAELGQTPLRDSIESPYSLFQNASGLPTLGAEIRYEGDGFFYYDRWVLLNKNLNTTLYTKASRDSAVPVITEDPDIYDDRGAVLKTFGIRKGNFRFGFQDSAVFTGDFFDFNYFANPLPSIFIQYIAKAPGRPWTITGGDHNTIMGFFADYIDDERYAYAQILVDDINMNRFLNPSGKQNPDKIAWSFGGTMESPLGTFGLYQAGATKYTFQSAQKEYYSYTMYPGSTVLWKNTESPIAIEDTMLGYLHGENNIALLGTWMRGFGEVDCAASLELTLSGAKSPANPWNEYDTLVDAGYGTRLLDDPVLEKKIVLGLEAGVPMGRFYLGAAGKLGYVANRLAAVATAISDEGTGFGNAQPIFVPSSESAFLGEFTLYGRVTLRP